MEATSNCDSEFAAAELQRREFYRAALLRWMGFSMGDLCFLGVIKLLVGGVLVCAVVRHSTLEAKSRRVNAENKMLGASNDMETLRNTNRSQGHRLSCSCRWDSSPIRMNNR